MLKIREDVFVNEAHVKSIRIMSADDDYLEAIVDYADGTEESYRLSVTEADWLQNRMENPFSAFTVPPMGTSVQL